MKKLFLLSHVCFFLTSLFAQRAENIIIITTDGLRWQDFDGPPLIQPGEPYDRGYCQAPSVLYHANSRAYYVYYNGATSGDPEKEQVTINLAIIPRAHVTGLRLRTAQEPVP